MRLDDGTIIPLTPGTILGRKFKPPIHIDLGIPDAKHTRSIPRALFEVVMVSSTSLQLRQLPLSEESQQNVANGICQYTRQQITVSLATATTKNTTLELVLNDEWILGNPSSKVRSFRFRVVPVEEEDPSSKSHPLQAAGHKNRSHRKRRPVLTDRVNAATIRTPDRRRPKKLKANDDTSPAASSSLIPQPLCTSTTVVASQDLSIRTISGTTSVIFEQPGMSQTHKSTAILLQSELSCFDPVGIASSKGHPPRRQSL
jgi:hypothetical protein